MTGKPYHSSMSDVSRYNEMDLYVLLGFFWFDESCSGVVRLLLVGASSISVSTGAASLRELLCAEGGPVDMM